jgi:hypothetical protein
VKSSVRLQRLQLQGQQEQVMDMSKSVGTFMKLLWLQEPENGLRRLLKQGSCERFSFLWFDLLDGSFVRPINTFQI